MTMMPRLLIPLLLPLISLVLFSPSACSAEPALGLGHNWPQWRGPDAAGIGDGHELPTTWSTTDNLDWSLELPGWGTSSPLVYGDRVFVTTETTADGKKLLLTMCFDRHTGE